MLRAWGEGDAQFHALQQLQGIEPTPEDHEQCGRASYGRVGDRGRGTSKRGWAADTQA